jgi:DNA-binding LacI/PurR family transcriptional regulator
MIDVARRAKVSQSAVSFVLSGSEHSRKISEKTAARIRRAARDLDFHPSHAARQLTGKGSGIVGAFASYFYRNQILARILACLAKEAASRGMAVFAEEGEDRPDSPKKFADRCRSWNVDGLIFTAMYNDVVWANAAESLAHLPRVISVVGDAGIPNSYSVESNVGDGVRQAVRHLYSQGRRRIAMILEALDCQINCRRHEAFLAAHAELGLVCDDTQVQLATRDWDYDEKSKWDGLLDELLDVCRADAVVADNDVTAAGLIAACNRRGVRVPDDLAFIGWGNTSVARWMHPMLTTIDFLPQQLLSTAMDLMTALIARPNEERPRTIFLKPELIVRASG